MVSYYNIYQVYSADFPLDVCKDMGKRNVLDIQMFEC